MMTKTHDLTKIAAILEASYQAVDSNIPHARQLAEEAFSLSPEASLIKFRAISVIGICDFYEGKYEQALNHLLTAIKEIETQEDKWTAIAYFHLGLTYHQLNLFTEASQYHQRQFHLAEKLGEKSLMASALRRMGADHDHLGYPQDSFGYYERSLSLYKELEDYGGMLSVYYNMSIAQYQLENYKLALRYAKECLPYFDKADNMQVVGRVHGMLALIYSVLGKEKAALLHAQTSLDISQKSGRITTEMLAYQRCAIVYRKLKQYDKGLKLLQKALDLVEQSKDPNFGIDVHQEAYEYHKLLNHPEQALYHHEKFHLLRVQQLEDAMKSRFEALTIVHRTQQAQAEADRQKKLREQDRQYFQTLNQMKDEVMSNASHDLKNPLTSIMTVIYLLKKHRTIDDDYGKELINRIETNAKQMRDLISNLLDLARLETSKALSISDTDIVAFARSISDEYSLLAKNQNLNFLFETKLKSLTIPFDSMMLRRVFENLLSNAIKFTPEGGTVSLKIAQEDDSALISIEDTGIGIPESALAHIFERFYRVENNNSNIEGTGLGLPICKAIIEQHGGTIGVASTEGQGTNFWFRLPLKQL